MSLWSRHAIFEKNSIVLVIGVLIVIAIGGLVEIAPLFYLKSTIEKVDGMRPYTPLELAGRNIYVREGCYNCHSQMIRPLRDEVERYGHYSLAAESMYDRPFQWGSKRTGPDLARVGGKYSDDWHRDHLHEPKSVVPGTVMPAYPWLAATELDFAHIADDLKVQAALGVPYTPEMIANAARRRAGAGRPPTPTPADLRQALSEGAGARLRRQSRPHHRSRRADRLSAGARHAGRLQALRRQGQHPLRQHERDLSGARRIRPDLGPRLLRRGLPARARLRALAVAPGAVRRSRPHAAAGGLIMADRQTEVDTVTGTATTGHEWDGIRELNTPLPRWWLWMFYATIVWAVGYWIVYPSWPLVSSLHAPACSAGTRAPRS